MVLVEVIVAMVILAVAVGRKAPEDGVHGLANG